MRHRKSSRRGGQTGRRFVEDRRDPTGARSWRQTPVFVGDAVAHVDAPTWMMFVTGVLPRGRVEVVTFERVHESLGEVTGLDSIQTALADGRIIPRAMPRRELAPVTESLAERHAPDFSDTEEVTA